MIEVCYQLHQVTAHPSISVRNLRCCCVLLLGTVVIFGIVACRCESEPWKLVNVSGYLPDLMLDLITAGGKRVD